MRYLAGKRFPIKRRLIIVRVTKLDETEKKEMYRLLIILIFLPFLSMGQSTFADDSILQRLSDSLPKGWAMVIQGNQLIISAKDSVWERWDYKANQPLLPRDWKSPTEEETKQLFIKEGHKVLSGLIFKLAPRWSAAEIDSAEAKDSIINDQVKKLLKKYNVFTFPDEKTPYRTPLPKSREEKKRIDKFKDESGKLLATLVKVPRLHSQKYSLFEVSETGITTWFISTWPPKAEEECSKIDSLIDDILYMRRVWIYDGKY